MTSRRGNNTREGDEGGAARLTLGIKGVPPLPYKRGLRKQSIPPKEKSPISKNLVLNISNMFLIVLNLFYWQTYCS